MRGVFNGRVRKIVVGILTLCSGGVKHTVLKVGRLIVSDLISENISLAGVLDPNEYLPIAPIHLLQHGFYCKRNSFKCLEINVVMKDGYMFPVI